LRAREIDGRDLAAAQQERGDVFKLQRRRQIQFGATSLGRSEREAVVGFDGRLLKRAARDFSASARRVEERAIAGERGAQAARNIYVARDANERLILADGVVGDEALHARLAPR